jgi:hypothetical protein
LRTLVESYREEEPDAVYALQHQAPDTASRYGDR